MSSCPFFTGKISPLPSREKSSQPKAVKDLTTGVIYPSVQEAVRDLGVSQGSLRRSLAKSRGLVGGRRFEFV